MKFDFLDPPRVFHVGVSPETEIRDTGRLALEPGEQVTFVSPSGSEYDVARMEWGYYATPSVNGRLPRFGLRAALVRNESGRHFVLLVEKDQAGVFEEWLVREKHVVVAWLDNDTVLARIAEAVSNHGPAKG